MINGLVAALVVVPGGAALACALESSRLCGCHCQRLAERHSGTVWMLSTHPAAVVIIMKTVDMQQHAAARAAACLVAAAVLRLSAARSLPQLLQNN